MPEGFNLAANTVPLLVDMLKLSSIPSAVVLILVKPVPVTELAETFPDILIVRQSLPRFTKSFLRCYYTRL